MRQPRTRLFAIAVLIFTLLGISGGLLNVAWTYMQVTFGVKLSAIGVLLLCGTTGSLLAAFGSGTVIGRLGIGRVAITGAVLVSLGLLGVALAPTWLALVLIIFVLYVGRGTLDAGMNNFVSEHYDSAAMNWLHASWGVGLTVSPAIITFVIVRLGLSWRIGYAVIAGVAALLVAVIAAHLRQWDATETQAHSGAAGRLRRAPASESIRQPVVQWSILLFFVYGGIEVGTGQLANTLLVESRAMSQSMASLWLSFYWGSFTVGRILMGMVALRFSDQVILRTSTRLALVGAALLLPRGVPLLNVLGLMLIGFGLAAIFPVLIAQTPQRVGSAHAANAIGFQVGFAGLGASILPGLFGAATAPFGLEVIGYGLFLDAVVLMLLTRWVTDHVAAVRGRASRPAQP